MRRSAPHQLNPRKTPLQARAAATRDVILEATVHVLLDGGMQRLTTTRVAKRAGVSVGSLYQYFPHKEALIYAVNALYLSRVVDVVEAACRAESGQPLARMIEALVSAYSDAKLANPDVTRALYRSVAELDIQGQIDTFSQRVDAATLPMLRSAPDACFDDLELVNLTLLTTIFGAVRNVFERGLSEPEARTVHQQLTCMCLAYLQTVSAVPSAQAVQSSR